MRPIALLMILGALPMFGQSSMTTDPVNPVETHPAAIMFSLTVPSSLHFDTPAVSVSPSPYEWAWGPYPQQFKVTISQAAAPDGNGAESVDQGTVVMPFTVQGVYSVTLELTVGSTKNTYSLGSFAVAPPCAQEPSAIAQYSWKTSGYELYFADWSNANVSVGTPALVSIDGNHVTVRQSLTYAGIPSSRSSCLSGTVDLGAIPPGTYHLTWIYDEFFAPVSASAQAPTMTRELTFEAKLPKRRTSRR